MSKNDFGPIPVIEWSPTHVRVFNPGANLAVTGPSLAAVRPSIEGGEVVVAISRRSSFLRTARLPDAPKKDVVKILHLQVGQLFPLAPGEAAVDFYLAQDRNSEGRLAVVAAVKAETLKFLQDELTANGLSARAVVPAALGSSLMAKSLGKTECAIVEEVPEGLAIDIVSEGELRSSRVVPMPSLDLVDGEVTRSFAVAKLPCSETVAAGGFAFPEMNSSSPKSGILSLMQGALPLTLEPPDVVLKRDQLKISGARRTAIILWLAAFMLGAVVWDMRSRDAEVVEKGSAKWKSLLSGLKKTHDQGSAKLTSLRKVDTALDLGFEGKQKLSDVTSLLNNLTPDGLWLTGITIERGKLALLRGTATNGDAVTKFLEVIAAQPRFRDCKLVFATNGEIEKVNVVQFSISAHVVGNLPLATEDAK